MRPERARLGRSNNRTMRGESASFRVEMTGRKASQQCFRSCCARGRARSGAAHIAGLATGLLLTLSVFTGVSAWASLTVTGLKCEYRTTPLGIDQVPTRLNWLLESKERGQKQTTYRILAATSPDGLSQGKADLWDSGEVSSVESIHVTYGGKPLLSGERVYWKVRAWDRDHKPSAYSEPSWWEMGLLHPARLARLLDHPRARETAHGSAAFR